MAPPLLTRALAAATLGLGLAAPPPAPPSPAPAGPAPPAPRVTTEPDRPLVHFSVPDEQGRPIEVYPPLSGASKAPLVVVLHATCMTPASVCDAFGEAARDRAWLVCPSGNSTCYGAPDWHGAAGVKASFLEAALDKVTSRLAPFVDERPGVLIGWSRGAFAARDILYVSQTDAKHAALAKRFQGLVLLAAHVTPEAAKLRAAGITRVVMGAGDLDGSRPTMQAAVVALNKAGIVARYVSLGPIAHVWPDDFEQRMKAHIDWAAGE